MIQATTETQTVRCAIYTRKSHEEGLEQEFNSLDAQREAAEAFIVSQRHEGWQALPTDYSDGGFTGANIERPGLQRLMKDIERGRIDCVVVYKVDRLSRSLLDFATLIGVFDQHDVSFVSVTQQFNTATSMGRLVLNVLLSFAQFEREIIGERIRDKKLASAMKGKYIGGQPLLGYDVDREKMRLLVNPKEAELVRSIFGRFIKARSSLIVARELNEKGHHTKAWTTKKGKRMGGKRWNKVYVYRILKNRKYIGEVVHKGQTYPGEHDAIVDRKTWDQVHRIIAENSHARAKKTRRKTTALLRGILRCGHCGTVMGTSMARKGQKRYGYYRCNHAERNGHAACPVNSVGAGEVEKAVVDQLRAIFRSPDVVARTFRAAQEQEKQRQENLDREKAAHDRRLAELRKMIRNLAQAGGSDGALADELRKLNEEYAEVEGQLREVDSELEAHEQAPITEAEVIDALGKLDPVWDELFPAERERVVRLLVKEAVLSPDGLTIRIRANGLRSVVTELRDGAGGGTATDDAETLDVHVPMELKRRGGRKEIILPPNAHTAADVRPRRPIVVALARAYRWQEMLDAGQAGSIAELAQTYDVDRSYIGRVLRLAGLAPDLVEMIVRGDEPSEVSLGLLRQANSARWDDQRDALGFAPRGCASPACSR